MLSPNSYLAGGGLGLRRGAAEKKVDHWLPDGVCALVGCCMVWQYMLC